MAAVSDAAAQKVTVLAGTDLSGLQPPLQPTPAKVQTGKVASVGDDEVYICLGGEKCTVCGEKCKTVKSLQEHIVKKHCTVSNQMIEMLKMQQQLMNTILQNQTT